MKFVYRSSWSFALSPSPRTNPYNPSQLTNDSSPIMWPDQNFEHFDFSDQTEPLRHELCPRRISTHGLTRYVSCDNCGGPTINSYFIYLRSAIDTISTHPLLRNELLRGVSGFHATIRALDAKILPSSITVRTRTCHWHDSFPARRTRILPHDKNFDARSRDPPQFARLPRACTTNPYARTRMSSNSKRAK